MPNLELTRADQYIHIYIYTTGLVTVYVDSRRMLSPLASSRDYFTLISNGNFWWTWINRNYKIQWSA